MNYELRCNGGPLDGQYIAQPSHVVEFQAGIPNEPNSIVTYIRWHEPKYGNVYAEWRIKK